MYLYEEGLKRYYSKIAEDVGKFVIPFMKESEVRGEFPNDVKYFDREQVKEQIRYWNGIAKAYKEKHPYVVWDKIRGESCLGEHGIVAKRCSMNNDLWELWVKSGQKMTIEELGVAFKNLKYFEMIQKYPDRAEEGFSKLKENRDWKSKWQT